MFCAFTRPRYQVSVYRTIGPLVYILSLADIIHFTLEFSLQEENANCKKSMDLTRGAFKFISENSYQRLYNT